VDATLGIVDTCGGVSGGEGRPGVDGCEWAGVNGGLTPRAVKNNQDQAKAGGEGKPHQQAAAGAQAADRRARRGYLTACPVGVRAGGARAAPVGGAGAFPETLGLALWCDEKRFALRAGAAVSGGRGAEAARATLASVAAEPVFLGPLVAGIIKLGSGLAAFVAHPAPPLKAWTRTTWRAVSSSRP